MLLLVELLLRLALDAADANVGVQHVGRGVAGQRQHLVEREAVVAQAVHRQVGVLDRRQADRPRDRLVLLRQSADIRDGRGRRFSLRIDVLVGSYSSGSSSSSCCGYVSGGVASLSFHEARESVTLRTAKSSVSMKTKSIDENQCSSVLCDGFIEQFLEADGLA